MSFKKPFRAPPIRPSPTYLRKFRRKRRTNGLVAKFAMPLAVATGVFAAGMAVTNWQTVSTAVSSVVGRIAGSNFGICVTQVRWNCVVDGDTFWRNGHKIRIADIDTPEIFSPHCESEMELGLKAQRRLRELLNAGPFELQALTDRDRDSYDRELRVVVRDGRSLGDQLVSEGLARTWTGRREPWC